MRTKDPVITEGEGLLTFSGFRGQVAWRIEGEVAKLRPGRHSLRGAITTTAEIALDAFRAGEGLLTLESGAGYRLTMLAHTPGGDQVFVELRA